MEQFKKFIESQNNENLTIIARIIEKQIEINNLKENLSKLGNPK